MSMTREEAIALFEKQLTAAQVVLDSGFGSNPGENNSLYRRRKEMAEIALTALRPVSREQVEKVWGFGGWETVPDQGFVDTMGRQVYHLHCHHCGFFWREKGHAKYFKFCPACGAPMTDEAVDMVMERMEALKDE